MIETDAIETDDRATSLNHGEAKLDEAIGRYDHVTRLPNRLPFLDYLDGEIAAMRGDSKPRTLFLITLAEAQHYNEILRSLGHAFAEQFVRDGARLVGETVARDVAIFHVSVLSFAFVVPQHGQEAPRRLVESLLEAFRTPIVCQAIPIQTRVGIGLLELTSEAVFASEVLRAALTAAQDSRSREEGFAYYDASSDAAQRRVFQILTDLPRAMERDDQLQLFYQPRIDLASKTCVGAEALIRWYHPVMGWISPGEFIPLVETTAMISNLTANVLDMAMRDLRRFHAEGLDLKVSVNVSPPNLGEPAFVENLTALLQRYDVAPQKLELEFTEGAVSPNNARMQKHLIRLREMGIEVAIDDFGSGYSNMAYLTRIPADTVKIDQAFIRGMDGDPQNAFLVQQIINLAQGLGFKTVGEGIETAESFRSLAAKGCDEGQGFHMSKPLPRHAFLGFITTYCEGA